MHTTVKEIAAMAAGTLLATSASAQSAKDVRGPSPLVAIENEAPPKLIVDPPLPDPLALGRVFIQYRTENLRVLPVFGTGALEVSPRIGHLHVTVDDLPWIGPMQAAKPWSWSACHLDRTRSSPAKR